MKHLIITFIALASLLASASQKTSALLRKAEKLDFTPEQLSRLESLCEDYERAADALNEYRDLMGLKDNPPKKTINADVVDPTIRKIQEQARKYHNRFEVLKRTQNKWGPSTNLLARAARQSMQARLNETRAERDQAKADAKALKDMQKAARKFGKDIEKVRKDFEKYRNKAATDEERYFWQSLLDIIPVPN